MSLRPRFAALALLACASISPGFAAAPAPFVQDGSIAAPLRFATDATYSSWPGGQRQVWANTGNNGTVGYTFALPPD